MEATGEESLLKAIRPPRLEDAGLEDCALSAEAIKEAFLRAANSLRSGASSILTDNPREDEDQEDDDDVCIQDPGPSGGILSDKLVGVWPAPEHPRPCGSGINEGGGLPEVLGDEAAVDITDAMNSGKDLDGDRVLGAEVPEGGGKSCVDGLQGLKIEEKPDEDTAAGRNEEDQGKEDEQPILVGTYI
ncbi:PREDICTED: uncharacterized protein LOC104592194 [Nelumbo nucifera]|uniref:Uncharacterized protein n=2 Tax=Nelumbo nucifera TaxID=4432 RepID=A0A822ZIH0_NELNU|nr:PREDICTED: uncharacterized protein LOC104592194 [Nelumbo nucifera]DAD44667.1 TPA_asm: hypothetical protein HUJ06_002897 [Nelumbo nucifera]